MPSPLDALRALLDELDRALAQAERSGDLADAQRARDLLGRLEAETVHARSTLEEALGGAGEPPGDVQFGEEPDDEYFTEDDGFPKDRSQPGSAALPGDDPTPED